MKPSSKKSKDNSGNEMSSISFSPLPRDMLAKVRIDVQRHTASLVERYNEKNPQQKKMPKEKMHTIEHSQLKHTPMVDTIWKYIDDGKIDIIYACVGYAYDGQMVLDHGLLVDLLVNYGFNVNDALVFIDELAEASAEDKDAPIVMTNLATATMLTDIEPIA